MNQLFQFRFKYIIVLLLLIFSLCSFSQNNKENSYDILFLGSSYFGYNNLPALCKDLFEDTQKDVNISNYNPGGVYLDYHASSSISESKINECNWDFIILQGVGSLMAYPDYYTQHPVSPALEALKTKIHNNCESTRIIYCLPWAYEDGMTWVPGWDDTYEDMQILIYYRTLEYSNDIGFAIAPVGWVWYKILEDKNYPLHYLHMSDWNHPSLKGSYVMANVIYSTIFLESTTDNNFNSTLASDEADYFKEISSKTVLDSLDLWNISPYTDTTYSDTISSDTTNTDTAYLSMIYPNNKKSFKVYQNFPNPFSSESVIKFEVLRESKITIKVFDITGKSCGILTDEKKLPGVYTIKIDGSKYKSGTYFYSIQTANDQVIKQFQIIK